MCSSLGRSKLRPKLERYEYKDKYESKYDNWIPSNSFILGQCKFSEL